jgi:hypothetical protein
MHRMTITGTAQVRSIVVNVKDMDYSPAFSSVGMIRPLEGFFLPLPNVVSWKKFRKLQTEEAIRIVPPPGEVFGRRQEIF